MESSWMVFSDDWGRHPSSCQYLISQLLDRVDVTWVNTMGMRTPRLDLATFHRGLGKIVSLAKAIKPRNDASIAALDAGRVSPKVLNPLMWPWFTRKHDRWLNQKLLARGLASALENAPSRRIAITTIPIVADLVGRLNVDRWVYYCVDDFSVWPGLDQRTMLEMERELVAKVDSIVVVSQVLQDRLNNLGRSSILLTHGVDWKDWSNPLENRWNWPEGIRTPIALFWGVVDRRLDGEFLQVLANRMQEGTIVLVGPKQDPDPAVIQMQNVKWLPAVDRTILPAMAHAADCLIMPYSDSAVTRAMQPLKFKEYLATGCPVVARQLPSTETWSDACDIAGTAHAFADAVLRSFQIGVQHSHVKARERIRQESWELKSKQFFEIVESFSS